MLVLRSCLTLSAALLLLCPSSTAFVQPGLKNNHYHRSSSALSATATASSLSKNDAVLLLGPGFLQLNIAKAAKAAGLRPVIVAPQQKIDSFSQYLNDDDLIRDATIGIPDPGEPFYGELAGVVFCAEEAILPKTLISQVLDWKDQDIYCKGGPKRVVACAPITDKVNNEKSMGWVPIFNNDKKEKQVWNEFVNSYNSHPVMKNGSQGSLIRFGSLLGGSVDGADELQALGLDECIYKMSLENYRDLKERSFDRYRLGVQILSGDAVNIKPPNQEKMEKSAIKKGEVLEAFRAVGGYPEQDRANRHSVAQAVVQSLMRSTRPVGESGSGDTVEKEITVLSKCISQLPTADEWDDLFANPGCQSWPDPATFVPEDYGFELD